MIDANNPIISLVASNVYILLTHEPKRELYKFERRKFKDCVLCIKQKKQEYNLDADLFKICI